MFCGKCGKRLNDDMLFCPFCGTKVVVPEQDVPSAVNETEKQGKVVSLYDIVPSAVDAVEKKEEIKEEEFEPLRFDFDMAPEQSPEPDPVIVEQPAPAEEEMPEVEETEEQGKTQIEDVSPDPFEMNDTPVKPAATPEPEQTGTPREMNRRRSNTLTPVRVTGSDNLFMMEKEDFTPADDDYDLDDEEDEDTGYTEYEERESGSFFRRHIRGMVALLLLLVVIAVMGIWTVTESGQKVLAKMNLAWKPAAYISLAEEAYSTGSYDQAGSYYAKAYDRSDLYECAKNAAACFTMNSDYSSAEDILTTYINAHPNYADAYVDLMSLYGDASSRPWNITELIKRGYEKTGDPRLNV